MSDVVKVNIKKKQVKASMIGNKHAKNGGFLEENDELTLAKKLENEYTKGYNEGYQAGTEESERNYEQILLEKNEEFYNILTEMEERFAEYEESFAKIVIEVSSKMASKILHREISNKSIIQETLSEALTQVITSNKILVKINPEDMKILEANENGIGAHQGFAKIRFEPDPSIERGGCFVETELGNIDAQISSQINEIVKQLELNLLKEEQTDASS